MIKNILRPFNFILTMIKVRFLIQKIDNSCPFEGKLGENIFYQDVLPTEIIKELKKIYKENNKIYKENNKIYIQFTNSSKLTIEKIFNIAKPLLRDYMGPNVFLDGMSFIETEPNLNSGLFINQKKKYFAENWHTDNVGTRIKCYICLDGDGSQPTLILKSKKNKITFIELLQYILIEAIRWSGIKFKYNFNNTKYIFHKTSTISFFDTNHLHRGEYSKNSKNRLVLIMEFSNPSKHSLLTGPIGTNKKNNFLFDKDFLEIENFKDLIDINRIHYINNSTILYSNKIN